ncbi:hypothetical protein Tco_1427292 [Tanacetum coccineum]
MMVQAQEEMGEDNVADEAVYEEMDDSLEMAATTATSLDAEQDRSNINKTQSKETLNEPSSIRTSSGSGLRRQETMGDTIAQTRSENVSKLSNDPLLARVIDLEKTKTSQAQEITSLKRRVKRLEKKNMSKTHGLKRLYKVGMSARIESSEDEDEDMFRVNDLEGDEVIVETEVDLEVVVETEVASKDVNLSVDEVTLAQALAALKSAKPKADKVMLQETGQGTIITTTAATTVTAASTRPKAKGLDKGKGIIVEEPLKMKKKDQVSFDEQEAIRLQAEFDEYKRLAREKDEANVALTKEWNDIQAKIDDDYQLAQRLQAQEQEELNDEEKARLFIQFLEQRRKHFGAKRAEEKRNRPPTRA